MKFVPNELLLAGSCGWISACPDPKSRSAPRIHFGFSSVSVERPALGAGFRRIETCSLGLALPPLRFGHAFARVPGLLTALGAREDRVAGLPGLRRLGDHVLLVYERG